MKPSARDAALLEIDRIPLPGWPTNTVRGLRRVDLADPRDIDLAERIATGVVKHLLTLRWKITQHSGRSLKSIDVVVQKILAVAQLQLDQMPRIAAATIVDEAVEQTKRLRLGRAAGFVNAVLRRAAEKRDEPIPTDGLDAIQRGVRLHSHPPELMRKLVDFFGEDRAIELAAHHNRPPPLLARLTRGTTIESLRSRGIDAVEHEQAGIVVLNDVRRETIREIVTAGLCQPQDATSAAVVEFLKVEPGQRVLDRCAGRGTKTRQIIESLGDAGSVLAVDSDEKRIASLIESVKSSSVQIETKAVAKLATLGPLPPFDRVLIDAPCSNSSVLARRAEARYRQTDHRLTKLIEIQRAILADTFDFVAPGGLLAYSTCSIWEEENQRQIDWVCDARPDFEPVEERTWHPNPTADARAYRDGGFVAILRRIG